MSEEEVTKVTYNLGTVFLNRKEDHKLQYIDPSVPILISFLFITIIILVIYTFLQKEVLFIIDLIFYKKGNNNKIIPKLKKEIEDYYLTCENNTLYAIKKDNSKIKIGILYLNSNEVYNGKKCQEIVDAYV